MRRPETEFPEIQLDELPRHSGWPARLLSLQPEPIRLKTHEEVIREFDRDKWGQMLARARVDPLFDLAAAESSEVDPEAIMPFFDSGRLLLAPYRHVLERHISLYSEVLGKYAADASALVELGAGFGSKILRLGSLSPFDRLPLYAAELTSSGRALISLLAGRAGKAIAVGTCDFREGILSGVHIPPDAVVFTSYAVHYVPELSMNFVKLLGALAARAIVHFEPCLEHLGSSTLHELLCRNYILHNDYNRNLVSVLKAAEVQGSTHVMLERPRLMGGNPLLPLSVIAWRS